jgi:ribosomal protein S18 acetylase RimI-like enzyme
MIRRAHVKDAPAVHALLLAARDDIPFSSNVADQAYQDWVRQQCRKQWVWLDERESNVAGIMVMDFAFGRREILYLVTESEFRCRGVASGLVDHAISYVQRHHREGVTARAREQNISIVRLLLKKGFYRHPVLESPGWTVFAFG